MRGMMAEIARGLGLSRAAITKWPRVPAERVVAVEKRSPASRASCCGLTCGQPLAIAANRSTAVGGKDRPRVLYPENKKAEAPFLGRPEGFYRTVTQCR